MSEQWLPSASDQEDMQGPTVQELQDALAQQAQELDRVTKECNHQTRQRAYELEKSLKQAQEIERLQCQLEAMMRDRDWQLTAHLSCRDEIASLCQRLASMTTARDEAQERCRASTQIIIETIGSCGPESLESALGRMVAELSASQARVKELEASVLKWQRIRKPTHGNCCTCQRCGLDHDSCRCDLDEVYDELTQLQATLSAREVERDDARTARNTAVTLTRILQDKLTAAVQRAEQAEAALNLSIGELENIIKVNVKDWDDPTDAAFKAWAQSRARFTIDKVNLVLKGETIK